jgi:plastocyanin
VTRRELLEAGGLWLAGLAVPRPARAAGPVEIRMMSDPLGTVVWFDPIGIRIEPGQTVRFIVHGNVHTTTAYHPRNDRHSLRIPEQAEPWDSKFLVNPGSHFEVTLRVPGVYDYFCAPHEAAGMVGRIVVGRPDGPGALPFDYYDGRAGTSEWKPVPAAARKAFPPVSVIMRDRVVRKAVEGVATSEHR